MSLFPNLDRAVRRRRRESYRVLLGFAVLLWVAACGPSVAPRTSLPPPPSPPLEREIRGGEVHAYPVELQTGQFLRVVAEEQGIDLTLRLLDPQGALLTGADSSRTRHTETSEELAAL